MVAIRTYKAEKSELEVVQRFYNRVLDVNLPPQFSWECLVGTSADRPRSL